MSSSRPTSAEQLGALVEDRLLQLLSERFPLKHPKPGTPLDRVMFESGHQEVIEYLRECQRIARAL